ncbi:MAG: hypothetical protein KDD22_08590 [Bdellovibrionales bacterium]|nr:hypothetical protein [Bdellovibrionales bacterium]
MKKTIVLLVSTFLLSPLTFAKDKLRATEEVLKGVYTRAGGPGGKVSLSENLLEDLCKKGYGTAIYLYPTENFTTKGNHPCGKNTLAYVGGGFRKGAEFGPLEKIYAAINGNGGPVVAHCWNGWHASGELAAKALMQFCDYSGQQAADYWAATIGDKGNLKKYGSILKRIKAFKPRTDLKISSSTQAQICPNK